MLLGPGGVGKTSLKRGLMGLEFDTKANSTIVADVHSLRPVPVDSGKDDDTSLDPVEDTLDRDWVRGSFKAEWTEVTERDEIEELARLIAYTTDVKEDDSEFDQKKISKELWYSKEQHSTTERRMNSKILDEAFKLAKVIKSQNMPRPDPSPYFHLWDCGGQPVFQEVLPVFLTGRTMFLLLFDATKDLNKNIEQLQYQAGKEINQGSITMSTMQLLEGWMSNIHSYLLKTDKDGRFLEYPRVIPVGTHGDKLKTDAEKEQVKKNLRETCEAKEKAFSIFVKKPIIIDNTTAGKGPNEDPNYEDLRKAISEFAIKDLIQSTPITWVLYRKLIQLLVKESDNKYISLNEAKAIGVVCKVPPDHVHRVLEFYHDLGVLLYYPNVPGLEDTIILDPKWFVDCLGMVLTLPGVEKNKTMEREWDLLRTKGILVQPLYADVWKNCKGISSDSLIRLLASFQLAVEVQTDKYYGNFKQFFVPAVLPYFTDGADGASQELDGHASPLHITFITGYVVPGFFTRLITAIAHYPNWKLNFETGIYHNRVTYRFEATEVTFTEASDVIKVDVRCLVSDMPNESQKDCLEIKELCDVCSESVETCLRSNNSTGLGLRIPRNMKIVCQGKKCQGAGIHYVMSSPRGTRICCDSDDITYREVTKEEAFWFKDIDMNKFKMAAETADMMSSLEAIPVDPKILSSVPNHSDLANLLIKKDLQYEWDAIGRALGVSLGFRKELERQGITNTVANKLETVLNEWQQQKCSEVSWNMVIKVFTDLKNMNAVSDILRFLSSPEASKKYN